MTASSGPMTKNLDEDLVSPVQHSSSLFSLGIDTVTEANQSPYATLDMSERRKLCINLYSVLINMYLKLLFVTINKIEKLIAILDHFILDLSSQLFLMPEASVITMLLINVTLCYLYLEVDWFFFIGSNIFSHRYTLFIFLFSVCLIHCSMNNYTEKFLSTP